MHKMLLLLLITCVLSTKVIIFGADENYQPVTMSNVCEYPNDCYNDMILLANQMPGRVSISNVSYIMLEPLGNLSNCNLSYNSTDNIYLVAGLNTDYKLVTDSFQLEDSLWNTLIPMCDIWSIPEVII